MKICLSGKWCFLNGSKSNFCGKEKADCHCRGIIARERRCLNSKCGKKFKATCGCQVFCEDCLEKENDWFLNIEKVKSTHKENKRQAQVREANFTYRKSIKGKLRRTQQAKRNYQRRRAKHKQIVIPPPERILDDSDEDSHEAPCPATTISRYCVSIRNIVSRVANLGKEWAKKAKSFLSVGQAKEKLSSETRVERKIKCLKISDEIGGEVHLTELDEPTFLSITPFNNKKVHFNSPPLGGQGYLLRKRLRLFPKIPCMRPGCWNEFSPDVRAEHKKYCSKFCRQATQRL